MVQNERLNDNYYITPCDNYLSNVMNYLMNAINYRIYWMPGWHKVREPGNRVPR